MQLIVGGMTTITEHRTHFRKGSNSYSLEVTSQAGDDPAEGQDRRLTVRVSGTDPDGRVVADGSLEVDFAELGTIADMLSDELLAAAGQPARSRWRFREPPANQGRPWTPELDAELEKRWIAGATVREVAEHFERTDSAIRRRLPLIGCDPYVAGAYLPPPPSQRD